MQFTLPKSERHPLVQITVKAPGHREVMMFDDTHTTVSVPLPDGVSEGSVSVVAEFCDQFSSVDRWAEKITLKEAEKQSPRQPGREPEPETRMEPETITQPVESARVTDWAGLIATSSE
jgi:hypothetical protein